MTQGTRMHQAAMYLLYESPYAKMGGNVSDYEREPMFTQFLAGIPTLWNDTRVLDGRIADYIVILRQAADGTWWVGAMTDWTPRELRCRSVSCRRDRSRQKSGRMARTPHATRPTGSGSSGR